ncbi:MAG: hypothetical protein AB8G15_14700 [Saprospiraceae bacterium]
MKNLMKFGFSFLILCVLLLTSCSKEAPLQPQKAANDPIPLANEEVELCFANPNNPYEYVGEQHNLGLDRIAETPGFENLSIEEAHAIAAETVEANLGVDEGVPFQDLTDAYEFTNSEEPFLEVAQSLASDGTISDEAYSKLLEMNQILDDSEDPVSFGEKMIDFENEVMNNGSFTAEELEIILGAASIARHSTCYWMTAALNADNPWNVHLGLDSNGLNGGADARWGWWKKVKRFFKRVIKWVKADISGYKYASKVIGSFWNGEKWVQVVASVVVGVIYSWKKIFG